MIKKIINLRECKPGMILSEPIYNKHGTKMVSANTKLNEFIIDKLSRINIEELSIYEPENIISKKEKAKKQFSDIYENNVEGIRSIFLDISSGKEIHSIEVDKITDKIMKSSVEKRNIVDCINDIKMVDDYTYYHCINVSMLSVLIGKWMDKRVSVIKDLAMAGILHDIGKIKIDQTILNKKGSLTEDEIAEIKKHPVNGYNIIKAKRHIPKEVKDSVLMHHERLNGSGYPFGVKEDEISFYSRVLAIADVFSAMTSNRSYRKKFSPFTVIETLEKQYIGALDASILRTFIANIYPYYIGRRVILSNGISGELVYINPLMHSKPVIKTSTGFIDLNDRPDLIIDEML